VSSQTCLGFLLIAFALSSTKAPATTVKVGILSKFHPQEVRIECESRRWEIEGERRGVGSVHVRVRNGTLEYALDGGRWSRNHRTEITLQAAEEPSSFQIHAGEARPRRYRGKLILRVRSGTLQIINEVPLRDYLQSVVAAEA